MGYIEDFYRNPDLADGFGSTAGGRSNPHRGLDHPKGLGASVPSLAAGVVVDVSSSKTLGNVVEVRHDDGMFAGYRHLRSSGGPHVRVGQRVEKGTKIGEVSDTGTAAFGYHLCQTIGTAKGAVYGVPSLVVDPWPWVQHYVYGAARPGGAETPSGDFERAPGGEPGAPMWPVGKRMERLQRALAGKKRYNGRIDGRGGQLTAEGIQITLNFSKKNGKVPYVPTDVDGKLGVNNAWGVQHYGLEYGDYGGKMDGDPLALSWDSFILGLERP